jgi:hypothetical protein
MNVYSKLQYVTRQSVGVSVCEKTGGKRSNMDTYTMIITKRKESLLEKWRVCEENSDMYV